MKLEDTGNHKKTEVPLTDVPVIFQNTALTDISDINAILLPNINLKEKSKCEIYVPSEGEKIAYLREACFTPYDTESERTQWIYERKISEDQMGINLERFTKHAINKIPMYCIDYGCNVTSKEVYDKINEVLQPPVASNYYRNKSMSEVDYSYGLS